MGPLELTDFIGRDINYQVSRQIWQDMQYDALYPGHLQRSLVDAGLLGKRTAAPILPSKKRPAGWPPPMQTLRRCTFTANTLFYPVTTTCRASVATAARGTTAGITGGRPSGSMTLSPSASPMAARQNQLAEQTAADAFVVDVASELRRHGVSGGSAQPPRLCSQ